MHPWIRIPLDCVVGWNGFVIISRIDTPLHCAPLHVNIALPPSVNQILSWLVYELMLLQGIHLVVPNRLIRCRQQLILACRSSVLLVSQGIGRSRLRLQILQSCIGLVTATQLLGPLDNSSCATSVDVLVWSRLDQVHLLGLRNGFVFLHFVRGHHAVVVVFLQQGLNEGVLVKVDHWEAVLLHLLDGLHVFWGLVIFLVSILFVVLGWLAVWLLLLFELGCSVWILSLRNDWWVLILRLSSWTSCLGYQIVNTRHGPIALRSCAWQIN